MLSVKGLMLDTESLEISTQKQIRSLSRTTTSGLVWSLFDALNGVPV